MRELRPRILLFFQSVACFGLGGEVAAREAGGFVTDTYLRAAVQEDFASYGDSVALDGDTLLVGAPGWDGDVQQRLRFGAVFVYVREGHDWIQQTRLQPHNMEERDQFGGAVALSGDTAVVIARGESSNATGVNGDGSDNSIPFAGAAYVFVREGTTWTQQAYLKASNPSDLHNFGHALALHENTLVVADIRETNDSTTADGLTTHGPASNAGAAYVFVREGTTWSQQAYLKAPNAEASDWFSHGVAVWGDTIVIGAKGEDAGAAHDGTGTDNSASNAGAAYVFERQDHTWSQTAYLKASNAEADDSFGSSVAVAGDTIVVGAQSEDGSAGRPGDNSEALSGAAYVFVREGDGWRESAYLKGSRTDMGDRFGSAIAVSETTLVVAARRESPPRVGTAPTTVSDTGAAYVFTKGDDGAWTQIARLEAEPELESGLNFGSTIALSGSLVATGMPNDDREAGRLNGTGAAQVLVNLANKPIAITSIEKIADSVRLEMDFHPGTLAVEYSPDLSSDSWLRLGNFFFDEGRGPGTFIDPDPFRTRRETGYYRVFLRPEAGE